MTSTPEFESWVERARQKSVFEAYDMLGCLPLKKSSEGVTGPCPVCGGDDRFSLVKKKNIFSCRNCGPDPGAGDAIDLVKFVNGVEFVEAVKFLTGEDPPKGSANSDAPPRDDTAIREWRAEERARRDTEDKQKAVKQAEAVAGAQDLFARAKPFPGSLADKYMRGRGVMLEPEQSADLRFVPALDYRGFADSKKETSETVLGQFPCMLAAIRDAQGKFIGVHRTYLDPDGKGKLKPPGDTTRNNAKKVFGLQKNGHIRLGPIMEDMVMGEGIETTSSWYQFGIGPQQVGMMVGINLDNMMGWCTDTVPHPASKDTRAKIPNGVPDMERPGVIFPEGVKRVIRLGDGDSDYYATRAKMLSALRRDQANGITSMAHFAPEGLDFNNVLQREESANLTPPQTLAEFEAEVVPKLYPKFEFKSKYGARFLRDLKKKGRDLEWLIKGLITRGDKSMLAGPSRSGKSFCAIDLAMCVALGKPFFEFKTKQGLVCYQAGEGANGIKNRFLAYCKRHNIDFENSNIPLVMLEKRIDLFAPDGDTAPFIEELQTISRMLGVPVELVVIDTFAKAQGAADEINGKDMAAVLNNMDKIQEQTGAHVMGVHHMNSEGSKLRGHTSLFANMDQVLGVTMDPETKVRTLTTLKIKDGADDLKINFELKQELLGEDDDGDPITSCVVLPMGEKAELKSEESGNFYLANNGEKKLVRALMRALNEHGVPPPPSIRDRIPSFVRKVVDYEIVKEIYTRAELSDDEDSKNAKAARTQALKRAREKLQNNVIIGADQPFAWFNGRPVAGVPETYPAAPLKSNSKRKSEMVLAPGEDETDFPF